MTEKYKFLVQKGWTRYELFLVPSQNSFGEPGLFIAEPYPEELEALKGYPQYAAQQWLVDRGWTYGKITAC